MAFTIEDVPTIFLSETLAAIEAIRPKVKTT